MRLYNPSSCTPVGGSSTTSGRKAKWSPPNVFVPKRANARPLSEPRAPQLTSHSFVDSSSYRSFEVRDDHGNKAEPADDDIISRTSNSTLSTQSMRGLVRTPLQRNHGFFMARKATPAGGGSAWYSPSKAAPRVGRQSWSPRKDSVPLMVMPGNPLQDKGSTSSPPSIKLQPRPSEGRRSGKKENRSPFEDQISAPLASMSLITEPNRDDAFGTPKPSTSDCSDESSTAWLDFSLDGSENPFQADSPGSKTTAILSPKTTQSPFSPIEKAEFSYGRRAVSVRPSPVQRTKSAHVLFPTQHSRQNRTSFTTLANGPSAFAALSRGSSVRKSSPKRTASSMAARPAKMPLLTPSPRDVEPIVFRQDSTGDKENTKSKVSSSKNTAYLSKYTNMLKSDIPFGHVQFTMERDAIDVSIIELVVAAHGCR